MAGTKLSAKNEFSQRLQDNRNSFSIFIRLFFKKKDEKWSLRRWWLKYKFLVLAHN